MKTVPKRQSRKGFTLVELTVVILIIGIIATIAAPRFFDSLDDAADKSALASVSTLRDAIELHRANNLAYPGADGTEATLKTDLKVYLRNKFPKCHVAGKNDSVAFSTADPLVPGTGTESWIYNKATGEIRINDAAYINY